MAAPIGPGDWVECVSGIASPDEKPGLRRMSLGAIYCVEDVVRARCQCHRPSCGGLLIKGFYSDHPTRAWAMCAFRPIYRPKADLIESLKAPPKRDPKRQREAA